MDNKTEWIKLSDYKCHNVDENHTAIPLFNSIKQFDGELYGELVEYITTPNFLIEPEE
ncbi:hypothetical protein [Alteribacter populi]|uniref:hypothetical protein n=1 Tax=Alteribacter populi TaxID=2011011 RepID=UPI0012FF9FDF|nr:hypothetical protein [Alteribacter populi]